MTVPPDPPPSGAVDTRASWNVATAAHNAHKDDQAVFFREGGSTLFPDELTLLGPIAGKSLVHLQCNSGQDSLSLAALGAHVTGVDISDTAIEFATQLSADSAIGAQFVRAEVVQWLNATPERFDIAFASYGVLGWNADLNAWMRGAARVLKPGGRLVLMEFHPLIWSIDAELRLADPYFCDTPFLEPVSDYVGATGDALAPSGFVAEQREFKNPITAASYQWTAAQIVQAILDAGLTLRTMVETPYCNGCKFLPNLKELPGRRFTLPDGTPSLPLQLGLMAERPAG